MDAAYVLKVTAWVVARMAIRQFIVGGLRKAVVSLAEKNIFFESLFFFGNWITSCYLSGELLVSCYYNC